MHAASRRKILLLGLVGMAAIVATPSILAASKKKEPAGTNRAVLERQRDNLENLESAIKKTEKQVTTLKRREKSIVSMLDELDRKIDAANDRKHVLEYNKKLIELEMRQKDNDLQQIAKKNAQLEIDMRDRLRSLYQLGNIGYARLFLSLNDLRDIGDSTRVIKKVVNRDLSMLEDFRQEQAALHQRRERLISNQKRMQEILANLDIENREIVTQKNRQRNLLSLTRNQKDMHSRSLDEMKEAAANLQQLVEKLMKDGFRSDFGSLKGFLPLPTNAPVSGRFGKFIEPQFKTPLNRNGIEMKTKLGQEVRAIHFGKIIYAGWFTGYGKIVIVDHGDNYYSMSAHLEKTNKNVGDKVEAGELLGVAGATGSLKGPQLYFELRHRGQAIDPIPWFQRQLVKIIN